MNLNQIQHKIVTTINGPILVVAGAGSGKTRVIIYRIIYMIKKMRINPENILALTFTKKAANEMKSRLFKIINNPLILKKITIGTFHSIFSIILRNEAHLLGYNSNYTIYDNKDSDYLIKKILKNLNIEKVLDYRKIRKQISNYKNNLFFLSKKNNKNTLFYKVYKIYVKKCHQMNSLDFDDILLHTNYLFYRFPNILLKYQNKFKYILVDEYQDTNISQNNIIKKLSNKYKNIFVVGDDAQSIYSFRGAKISNILNFHFIYKNTKIFRLEQNYRSTNSIVKASNKIISFNKNQIYKKVWTDNEKGEEIKIYNATSDEEEAIYIANYILMYTTKKKFKYKDFAILYRTNYQSNIIELILKEKKIPYNIYGSISIEHRKEIKDLFSYLKFINNINDEVSLLRILNSEIKYKKTIKSIINISKKKNIEIYNIINNIEKYDINININTVKKLKIICSFLKKIRFNLNKFNAYQIVKYVIIFLLKKKKYENKIKEKFKLILINIYKYVKKKLRFYNINTYLSDFLQYFYLEDDNNENDKANKVSIMTVHLSKGLEYPIVFITGLEENIFPSKSCIGNSQIEEERRLFYVALTRAKKIAILTYATSRFLWGNKITNIPSRFINEINKLISIKYKKNKYNNILGLKIHHKDFGSGIILNCNNDIATIKFNKLGIKRILLSLNKIIF